MAETWRKCSSCKSDILTNAAYYVCSVSTCQGKATNYVFCGIPCWDAHVPVERHRPDSAGAIERKAPAHAEPPEAEAQHTPTRRMVSTPAQAASSRAAADEDEVLVVASKVRKYILDRSGMNTSAGVYSALSEKIRKLCDLAIEEARRNSRKTVMDRDVR